MEPPGSVELPLAAYRAATLQSVGGVVASRGIEPRSPALQAGAMTSLARWSNGADAGDRTRASCLRGRRAASNTSSTWSRLKDSNLDSPVIGRTSCRWTKPGCGASGGSRTHLVPIKSRARGRYVTLATGLAVGPGFEPGSFRLTAGRVAFATTLQTGQNPLYCH
jgi:hypothetical protein